MTILLDQGTPRPLRRHLTGHGVSTAAELGWSELENGDLLRAADGQFDLLITTDKNLRYQQNLAEIGLALLVLPEPTWDAVQAHIAAVVQAVNAMRPGQYHELTW